MTNKEIIEKVMPRSIPDLLYPENSDCPTGMFCNFIHRTNVENIIRIALSLQKEEFEKMIKKFFNRKQKQIDEHISLFGKGENREIDKREKFIMTMMPRVYVNELLTKIKEMGEK